MAYATKIVLGTLEEKKADQGLGGSLLSELTEV
jgi:hypothetical protein